MEAESLPAFAALMESLTYSACVPKNLAVDGGKWEGEEGEEGDGFGREMKDILTDGWQGIRAALDDGSTARIRDRRCEGGGGALGEGEDEGGGGRGARGTGGGGEENNGEDGI